MSDFEAYSLESTKNSSPPAAGREDQLLVGIFRFRFATTRADEVAGGAMVILGVIGDDDSCSDAGADRGMVF